MGELERGARNAYFCDVLIPAQWRREYEPRVVLAAAVDPDLAELRGPRFLYSFSFNTKKDRKKAVRRIRGALAGLEGHAKIDLYDTVR